MPRLFLPKVPFKAITLEPIMYKFALATPNPGCNYINQEYCDKRNTMRTEIGLNLINTFGGGQVNDTTFQIDPGVVVSVGNMKTSCTEYRSVNIKANKKDNPGLKAQWDISYKTFEGIEYELI